MLQELRARAMVFGGVRITLVFIVLHCDLLIIVCLFTGFFCIVCSSFDYHWYRQTFPYIILRSTYFIWIIS